MRQWKEFFSQNTLKHWKRWRGALKVDNWEEDSHRAQTSRGEVVSAPSYTLSGTSVRKGFFTVLRQNQAAVLFGEPSWIEDVCVSFFSGEKDENTKYRQPLTSARKAAFFVPFRVCNKLRKPGCDKIQSFFALNTLIPRKSNASCWASHWRISNLAATV